MIGYVIGTMVFLVILGSLIMRSINLSADTHNLEYYLLYNRMVYSKDSIFYNDPTIGRTYLGMIDFSKFKEETFSILFSENKNFGAKLSVNNNDLFYNKDLYQQGKYVFGLTNAALGGLINKFPTTTKDGQNSILLMGIMFKK